MDLCVAYMGFELFLTNPEEMIKIGLLSELEKMASDEGFKTEFKRDFLKEDGIHFVFYKVITTDTYYHGDPHASFTESMLDDFISRVEAKIVWLTYEIRKKFYDKREEYESNGIDRLHI